MTGRTWAPAVVFCLGVVYLFLGVEARSHSCGYWRSAEAAGRWSKHQHGYGHHDSRKHDHGHGHKGGQSYEYGRKHDGGQHKRGQEEENARRHGHGHHHRHDMGQHHGHGQKQSHSHGRGHGHGSASRWSSGLMKLLQLYFASGAMRRFGPSLWRRGAHQVRRSARGWDSGSVRRFWGGAMRSFGPNSWRSSFAGHQRARGPGFLYRSIRALFAKLLRNAAVATLLLVGLLRRGTSSQRGRSNTEAELSHAEDSAPAGSDRTASQPGENQGASEQPRVGGDSHLGDVTAEANTGPSTGGDGADPGPSSSSAAQAAGSTEAASVEGAQDGPVASQNVWAERVHQSWQSGLIAGLVLCAGVARIACVLLQTGHLLDTCLGLLVTACAVKFIQSDTSDELWQTLRPALDSAGSQGLSKLRVMQAKAVERSEQVRRATQQRAEALGTQATQFVATAENQARSAYGFVSNQAVRSKELLRRNAAKIAVGALAAYVLYQAVSVVALGELVKVVAVCAAAYYAYNLIENVDAEPRVRPHAD